jgi:hypothetical protein
MQVLVDFVDSIGDIRARDSQVLETTNNASVLSNISRGQELTINNSDLVSG